MKKNALVQIFAWIFLGLTLVTCKKETPAPTVEIYATVKGYQVTFNPAVTNASSYLWNFGDSATSKEANPVHTYTASGTYHVTLTVKGSGGENSAEKDIVIAASLTEMLTGGVTAVNGKTWVLSTAYTAGEDGGGPVQATMPLSIPSIDSVLFVYNLGAEYDNEFTFFANGNYTVNSKNGQVLAGAVFGVVTQTIIGDPAYDIGVCAATFPSTVSSTWSLDTTDFTVDAITDPNTSDVPPAHGDVTFTGKTSIVIANNADNTPFFGIWDFPPVTKRFIIKSITPTKMEVAMFLCGYGYGQDPTYFAMPTNLIHLTYVPKTYVPQSK